jgi:two-component system, OmpR family, alkaline phosphatase synthesis response regulator PhoP
MASKKLLIVDDEEAILQLLEYNLRKEGYDVEMARTGEEALAMAQRSHPDLMVLDLMLPGIDGLEVCREMKADRATARIPIIMLTAKTEDSDIVAGLELGAEDYVTKPFSPSVLVARVRACLRRHREKRVPEEEELIIAGDLRVDPVRHEALVGDRKLDLTATEFSILHLLARRPGWVFTRSQIIEQIKGTDYPVTERSVDVHIVGLRKKLLVAGERIETVRGVGYRFKE